LHRAGKEHVCIRRRDASVWCWGGNALGELGTGPGGYRPLPTAASLVGTPKAIYAGSGHACGQYDDGRVRCWGRNHYWQLGDRGVGSRSVKPVVARHVRSVEHVALGGNHSCVLLKNGTVRCWGTNGRGQMGDEHRERRTRSRMVSNLKDIVQVGAGLNHSCALSRNGRVRCWGDNRYGQLGDGSRFLRSRPRTVLGLTDATHVVGGEKHSCALRKGGSVVCWGSNGAGVLGTGKRRGSLRPVSVVGITDGVELRSNGSRTCVRTRGDEILCWGSGKRRPVKVGFFPGARRFDIGLAHVCVIEREGYVSCSGRNFRGQLGDGTRVFRDRFKRVQGLRNVVAIAAGNRFTCAMLENRSVQCWGDNAFMQLGYASESFSGHPRQVELPDSTVAMVP
jgi:alpha-tubulin suppressor-like RCC1 family protein